MIQVIITRIKKHARNNLAKNNLLYLKTKLNYYKNDSKLIN